jgi:hypothetical protein
MNQGALTSTNSVLCASVMQQEFRVDSSLRGTCDGNWDLLLHMRREDTVEYLTEEHQNSSRKTRRTMSPNI